MTVSSMARLSEPPATARLASAYKAVHIARGDGRELGALAVGEDSFILMIFFISLLKHLTQVEGAAAE